MTGRSTKAESEMRRAANVVLSVVAAAAVVSNLAAPFAPRLPVAVRAFETMLAGWLGICAWGSIRRMRHWPAWSWAGGLICVLWAMIWAIAFLKLRLSPWIRWLAPGDLWSWFRWAPGVAAVAGGFLMANALRVRGRG